ncbi:elongation factor P hydroxylase [Marinomonas sp. 2405UD68-3]|uniref:elongation factor P hydroxylase n=1 Tax=Marinomonas sp. 2405UD68-3 TaxID=3391835 RepID=UPI0039C8F071
MFSADELILCFNGCFERSHHVRLVGGASEPLYSPGAGGDVPAKIHFRLDYVSSALHEISHWCVAGDARLQLEDYGYWYEPDNRTLELQKKFEAVEVKPQAIEKAFHLVLGIPFRVSADNLSLQDYSTEPFEGLVDDQFLSYVNNGFPQRVEAFCMYLLETQGIHKALYDLLKEKITHHCG